MLILASSMPKGICYVETKNLDGETNLKHKRASKEILALGRQEEMVVEVFEGKVVQCEK